MPDISEDIPVWTCYTCGYAGEDATEDECCVVCGTCSGDGFGLGENDPHYFTDEG